MPLPGIPGLSDQRWVENLEKAVKPHLKKVGMGNINKWSPADILIRFANGKNPFLPDNNHIHHLLLKKYNEGKIIGVSLKKAGKDATLKVFNAPEWSYRYLTNLKV